MTRCEALLFRGGLLFKARRLFVSLNSRLERNKEEEEEQGYLAHKEQRKTLERE